MTGMGYTYTVQTAHGSVRRTLIILTKGELHGTKKQTSCNSV